MACTGPVLAQQSAAPAAAASATDAYTDFRVEYDAGRYAQAVPHAQRVLELAEKSAKAPTDEEVQVALMNLGMVQNLSQDYVGAEASFQRVIALAQSSGRPLHMRIARAYAGLGSAYHDGNRHDLAVAAFDQAIALTRRHEGLLTEQQVPLIEKYVDSLTQLGRYEDALKAQKYRLRIVTRKYGEGSVAVVPTLEDIGRWYTSIGAYDQARRTLREAIEIVEAAEGDKSLKLIDPLLALSMCNRRQLMDPTQQQLASADAERATMFHDTDGTSVPMGYSPGMMLAEGERSLQRAAAIVDSHADTPPVQALSVRTQLGDWYQLRSQPEKALPEYRLSWQAAQKIVDRIDGKTYADIVFGQPTLLHVTRPEGSNRHAGKPADKIEIRSVVLEFTVNTQGRVEKVKVVDDSGDDKRAAKTVATLEDTARYRPRFENGEPVVTDGVVFTQGWTLLLPPAPTTAPAPGASPAPATDPEPTTAPEPARS